MTETEICNLALTHIGAATISLLTEQSEEARTCTRLYAHARETLLTGHSWHFATKYVVLALDATATPYRFEYAYQYPTDCLKARSIYKAIDTADPVVFKRVGNNLWTNEENAVLIYTKAVTVPNEFSKSFILALSHFLAGLLVPTLIKSSKLHQTLIAAQQVYAFQAIQVDATEGYDDIVPSSNDPYNEARR